MGGVTVHGYDPNGNRATLEHPNGVVTTYDYDPLNRLEAINAVTAQGSPVTSFGYTLGPTGNRTKIVELDGTTKNYVYDDLYRLTSEVVTLGAAPRWSNGFTYDPVGNRQTQNRIEIGGTARNVGYTYDGRDRLLTQDTLAYGWDENGNLISKSGSEGATYDWDIENRLKRTTLADGTTVEHTYDVDGVRVRTVTTPAGGPAQAVEYLVDTSGPLSQVVVEGNSLTTVDAYYVRGDDLIAVIRPAAGAPATIRNYHADGLGSIRALTDESGTVTDTWQYEAFGDLRQHTGTDPNAYLFAGEPIDPNVGWYYNRARWMDPVVGLFWSIDPFAGTPSEPLSLHKYLYSWSDPANRIDPTGHEGLLGKLGAITVQAQLAATSLLASLRVAFGSGDGGAIGRLFYQLGYFAQRVATQIFQLFPRITVGPADLGRRALDYSLRLGNRYSLLEVKYSLPTGGPALTRLVDQAKEAVARLPQMAQGARQAQVVLWTYKIPESLASVRRVYDALGPVAAQIQFVHGPEGLFRWLRFYFRV